MSGQADGMKPSPTVSAVVELATVGNSTYSAMVTNTLDSRPLKSGLEQHTRLI